MVGQNFLSDGATLSTHARPIATIGNVSLPAEGCFVTPDKGNAIPCGVWSRNTVCMLQMDKDPRTMKNMALKGLLMQCQPPPMMLTS